MKVTVNLNDRVKFKLTPHGEECLRDYFTKLYAYDPDKKHVESSVSLYAKKEDGYSHTRLWDLMQVFGSYMHLGGKMPFESSELELES